MQSIVLNTTQHVHCPLETASRDSICNKDFGTNVQPFVRRAVQVLSMHPEENKVTFLGVSKDVGVCKKAARTNSRHGVSFECLQAEQFSPEVISLPPCRASDALRILQIASRTAMVLHWDFCPICWVLLREMLSNSLS